MMRAVVYPFSINPAGSVTYTADYRKVWLDRVRSVVSTTMGSRIMRPYYGADLLEAVLQYETFGEDSISGTLEQSLNKDLPDIAVQSITENLDEDTGVLTVDIIFATPSKEILKTTTVYDMVGVFEEDLPLLPRE